MMYLVSYDIVSNRKRRKIAETLKDFGRRVQYSVFECDLSKTQFQLMYHKMMEILFEAEENESIRIYPIPLDSLNSVRIIGNSRETTIDQDKETLFI